MSRFFVDPNDRVAIHDDEEPENTVWIRAKMDRRTKALVQDDLLRLRIIAQNGPVKAGEPVDLTVGVETQKLTLLSHNITRWEGPDFLDERGKPIPCTPDRIGQSDPDWPFMEKVAEEINRRNTPRIAEPKTEEEAADPNSSGNGTSRKLRAVGTTD